MDLTITDARTGQPIACSVCGKPATQAQGWPSESAWQWFCAAHAGSVTRASAYLSAADVHERPQPAAQGD